MGGPGANAWVSGYARILIAKPVSTFAEYALGKQNRRQPLASVHRRLIGGAPCLEELHQLLARAVLVPFAVALDDFEQLVGGVGTVAAGVERGGKIESRLIIERICGDFLFQLGDRAERLGLFGEIDRRLHRLDRRVVAL